MFFLCVSVCGFVHLHTHTSEETKKKPKIYMQDECSSIGVSTTGPTETTAELYKESIGCEIFALLYQC